MSFFMKTSPADLGSYNARRILFGILLAGLLSEAGMRLVKMLRVTDGETVPIAPGNRT
jgi:hypothetical protein